MVRRSLPLFVTLLLLGGTALRARSTAAEETPAARPAAATVAAPVVVASQQSGPWSDPATWAGGRLPAAGESAQIRPGHTVLYDLDSEAVIRAVHVGGTLEFARDRSTRLECGLIKIQPGDQTDENGFDCEMHGAAPGPDALPAALIVGSPEVPIPSGHQALIRLHHVAGMDRELCPAIVCCGGRMDFHGAPMSRTWLKLATNLDMGTTEFRLSEPVQGWKAGDTLLFPSTERIFLFDAEGKLIPTVRTKSQTEQRTIATIFQDQIVLDKPLRYPHQAPEEFRSEVANLSRNVIVESADPKGVRGHTMYHANSSGSISYAEFRHLGKKNVLGKYSIHFHLCRDTMRGSSVVGASIHDSDNRWITVHGTDYLIVRDCVGYNSVGHGFFLEDGTEVFNVFDRNLAIQALHGKPLPKQVLPYDENEGAGFWWSNCRNTFTRNIAAECDQYGFRFEASKSDGFDPVQPVPRPDGTLERVDIRTLPFVRFEDNEAHTQRRFSFNLGGIRHVSDAADLQQVRDKEHGDLTRIQGGHVDGVGPDTKHPFIVRNFKVWYSHWVFHGGSPSLLLDGVRAVDCTYGIFKTRMDAHEYRRLHMERIETADIFEPYGSSTVDENYYRFVDDKHDDLPPTTVITRIDPLDGRRLKVQGTTADNKHVGRVLLGTGTSTSVEATPLRPDYAEWEAVVDLPAEATTLRITAHAIDAKQNTEPRPHTAIWTTRERLRFAPSPSSNNPATPPVVSSSGG